MEHPETVDPLWQLLLSLVAIGLLTALAWLLGFRQQPVLDEDAARGEASAGLPGFRPVGVLLSADGRQALLHGQDGALALVFGHGDGWVVRRLPPGAVSRLSASRLSVRLGEPTLGQAALSLAGPAPAWLEQRA